MLAHVVPIGQTAELLDEQTQQDIAAVAVAASLAGREIRCLVRELREKVGGLGNRIVGKGPEEIGVILPVLFLSVIRDARGVGQQVVDVHLRRDGGVPQSQERNDGGIKSSNPWSISCKVATAMKSLVTEAVSKRVVKRFGLFQERLA
jgi:hypothetical protein